MENEKNDALNGEEVPENGLEKEDIPLWLQGIEESKDESTAPGNEEKDAQDQWIKEIPDKIGEEFDAVELSEEIIQNGEDLPEWIEEVPEIPNDFSSDSEMAGVPEDELDNTTFDLEEMTPNEGQLQQDDLKDSMSIDDQEEKTQHPDGLVPDEEEFMEISETEIQDEKLTDQDLESSKNEELPYWLQEMIAEPSEVDVVDQEQEVVVDEALEGAPIVKEFSEDGSLTAQQPTLDEPQLTDAETPESKADEILAEDNTKPVIVQSKEEYTPDILDGAEESVQESKKMFPDDLDNARRLLIEGKHSEAIKAINASEEKSHYKEDIRAWLLSASESPLGEKSDVWEALGDLALGEENPEDALDAYTKAIQALMTDGKALNGSD